jgi:hypothetical protein
MNSSMSSDEGEIIGSGSEKASTSLPSVRGTSVDRHSRTLKTSKSPPWGRSHPRRHDDTDHPRGEKRRRDEDEHYESSSGRPDTRRFKVLYEEPPYDDRRRNQVSYADLDRNDASDHRPRYHDRTSRDYHGNTRRSRSRTRSIEPNARRPDNRNRSGREDRGGNRNGYVKNYKDDRDFEGTKGRHSRQYSGNDRRDTTSSAERYKHGYDQRREDQHLGKSKDSEKGASLR